MIAVTHEIVHSTRHATPIIPHTVPITRIIHDMIDLVAILIVTTTVSLFMYSVC